MRAIYLFFFKLRFFFFQSINRKTNGAVHLWDLLNLFSHLDQQVFYITDYFVGLYNGVIIS